MSGENFTTPSNIGVGARINEFTFRKLVSWGLRKIRENVDSPNENIIDDLFVTLDAEERDQIKKYVRENPNIQFPVNWPPHDISLPFIAFINGKEFEDSRFQFMGDHMGFETTEALELMGGGFQATETAEERGTGLECETNIIIMSADSNLSMYLYWLVRFILFTNKDDLHTYYDVRDLTINGQDLRWEEGLWPTFAYMKMLTLKYNSLFSINLSRTRCIQQLLFSGAEGEGLDVDATTGDVSDIVLGVPTPEIIPPPPPPPPPPLLYLDYTTVSLPSEVDSYVRAGVAAPIIGTDASGVLVFKFGSGIYAYAYSSIFTHPSQIGALVEAAATNLHTNSEVASGWNSNSGVTITANAATAPDGTLTADQVVGTGVSRIQHTATGTASTAYVVSLFMRLHPGSSSRTVSFQIRDSIGVVAFITPTLTNEWVRYEISGVTSVGSTQVAIRVDVDADPNSIDVWGAQIEIGTKASSYIPTAGWTATRPATNMQVTSLVAKGFIDHVQGEVETTLVFTSFFDPSTYLWTIKNVANDNDTKLALKPSNALDDSRVYDAIGVQKCRTNDAFAWLIDTEYTHRFQYSEITGLKVLVGASVFTDTTPFVSGTQEVNLGVAVLPAVPTGTVSNCIVANFKIWAEPQ